MPRKPKLEMTPTGDVIVRVNVGPTTWQLATTVAERYRIEPSTALAMLLGQIEALLDARSVDWLATDWQAAAKRLDLTREAAQLNHIDFTKLHRSDKTKSGFTGVYLNGKGFSARGPNGEHIGQFYKAEEAAWSRYLYYKQRNLPYGQMEIDIAAMRQRGEVGSDGQLAALVLETAQHTATMHWYSAEEVAWAEAAAAKAEADGNQPYVPPESGPKLVGLEGGLETALARLRKHDASTPE